MPIPSSINDLSTTAASNSPSGSEDLGTADDYFRVYASYIAALRDVVLSGTANLSTANLTYTGTLTGSTGVLNIGSGQIYKDASGNVGIGTTSPVNTLHLGTSNARLYIGPTVTTNGAWAQFANAGGNAYVGLDSSTGSLNATYALSLYHAGAYPIAFSTNAVERMRIDASGNVGIGTAAPGARLQVQTPASGFGVIFRSLGATNNPGLFITTTEATTVTQLDASGSTSGVMALATSGTERMRIDSGGNVGIGGTANASAILDVQSTTKGLRLPNMTTAQKNAISSPAAGLMVFDTTLSRPCFYSGAAWTTL